MKMRVPASVWVALGLVYVIWGSTYLAIRFAVQTIPPFLMAGSRFLTSGILLYLALRLWGAEKPKWVHWKSASIAAFFLLVLANGGVSWAERKVPSGITALLVATVPLWMALLDWVWKRGPAPRLGVWAGILLGFTGVGLLVLTKPGGGSLQVDPFFALLLVGTSVVWSLGSLCARSAPMPSSPLLATAMEMITGGVFQLAVGWLGGETQAFHLSQMSPSSIWSWVYLTLVGSLVGFTSYIWVLQKSTPELASTYAFVNPVIAVFLGWALASEALTPSVFLAGAFIVGAVGLIALSPGKKA